MRWPAGAWAGLTGAVAAMSLLVLARPAQPERPASIDGFTAARSGGQRDIEQRLARFPAPRRLRADHRFLTAEPHVAGSPRDRQLAEWTRDQWLAAGLDEVQIVEHDVLLPLPRNASVEMLEPRQWHATLREHDDDPIAFHAYGAGGDVTAQIVEAGTGVPADFDRLAARGVDVRGKIILVRYPVPYSYRGYAVHVAQERGAAAILMYGASNTTADAIQRGGVAFNFLSPGDPLTPGWASTPGARRLEKTAATTLPAIITLPISTRDAQVILDALHRGPVTVHVRVANDDAVRPVWTVIGRIAGSRHPDEWVIAGNHRDAWMYGGVDPSSGSAVLMEMARALGSLVKRGERPLRSIVLASWDAEEFGLISSTEWGEGHALELQEKAVAYLNVDAAVSGPAFSARAVPPLAHVVASVAGVADSAIDTRIGAGSDYAVFLNFIGVPIADMRFQGPYDVYHSAHDTHEWVTTFADPGFLRHAELTRIWASVAVRVANADLLPLDEVAYGRRIGEFLAELERLHRVRFSDARAALDRFREAADAHAAAAALALARDDRPALDRLNRALMEVEHSLTDPAGLAGRPWYRHQVYAPAFTYAPDVLPGLSEALRLGDTERLASAERRLAAAFDRAARCLRLFTTFDTSGAS